MDSFAAEQTVARDASRTESDAPTMRDLALGGRSSRWGDGLFESVLEQAEIGILVLDPSFRVAYMNPAAKRMLGCDHGLPQPLLGKLEPMSGRLDTTAGQAIERWSYGDVVFRARLSALDSAADMTVLELTVTNVGTTRDFSAALSRTLKLRFTDARLLTMLWRGMRNDEIAEVLQIPVGTVKSRLYRLYQVLGVRNRAGAVLCAANVLGTA